MGDNILRTI